MKAKTNVVELATPTNGGRDAIEAGLPWAVTLTMQGASDLLFHRWNCESVDTKAKAAKNSKAKKSDDTESYLWRNEAGHICLPGEYLRQTIIHAAKFKQDPRSPRKSAMDLFKAGIVAETLLAPIYAAGKSAPTTEPDYMDTRRVTIQRNGINRTRPAFRVGWSATMTITVLTPEYINDILLRDVIDTGGRLVGVGDFRPTFGRFVITAWNI